MRISTGVRTSRRCELGAKSYFSALAAGMMGNYLQPLIELKGQPPLSSIFGSGFPRRIDEHEIPYGQYFGAGRDRTIEIQQICAPAQSIPGVIRNDYEIVAVEPTDPPGDMVGTGWHRYVIRQGKNTIRGYKRGDIKSVTRAVEEIVVRLNERRYGRSGRVQLTMSSQGKKAKGK